MISWRIRGSGCGWEGGREELLCCHKEGEDERDSERGRTREESSLSSLGRQVDGVRVRCVHALICHATVV